MKLLLLILLIVLSVTTFSQKQQFSIHNISLPKEISYYDNQFSGLYISKRKLLFMSESRLQDKAEAKLYSINLDDLDHKIKDTGYTLPYQKLRLYGLELLRNKIDAAGDVYEGLEALVLDGTDVYFSVETNTPSKNCYLIKGEINDTAVMMNRDFLVTIPKPTNVDGSHIYNAGFEALAINKKSIFAFFEYNYFPENNFVYRFDYKPFSTGKSAFPMPISKLPFRITDVTSTGRKSYTAINFFFKGDGADTVYRTAQNDRNNKLITDNSGYHSYCRLITVKATANGFKWKQLWEFPSGYRDYNWECIAAYKKGYFLLNDKYTSERPYISTLLYLKVK